MSQGAVYESSRIELWRRRHLAWSIRRYGAPFGEIYVSEMMRKGKYIVELWMELINFNTNILVLEWKKNSSFILLLFICHFTSSPYPLSSPVGLHSQIDPPYKVIAFHITRYEQKFRMKMRKKFNMWEYVNINFPFCAIFFAPHLIHLSFTVSVVIKTSMHGICILWLCCNDAAHTLKSERSPDMIWGYDIRNDSIWCTSHMYLTNQPGMILGNTKNRHQKKEKKMVMPIAHIFVLSLWEWDICA